MPRTNWLWIIGLLALLALGGCGAMSSPPRIGDGVRVVATAMPEIIQAGDALDRAASHLTPQPIVSATPATAVTVAAAGGAPSTTPVPATRVPPTAAPASPMQPTATVYPGYCVCRDPDGDGIDNISGARDPNLPQATPAPAATSQPVATVALPTSAPPTAVPTTAAQASCTIDGWGKEDDFPTTSRKVGHATCWTYVQALEDGNVPSTIHFAFAPGIEVELPANWVGTAWNLAAPEPNRWEEMRHEVVARDNLDFTPPFFQIDDIVHDRDVDQLTNRGFIVRTFDQSTALPDTTENDPFGMQDFENGLQTDRPMGSGNLWTYFEATQIGSSGQVVKVQIAPGYVVRIPPLWRGYSNHQTDRGTPAADVIIIDGDGDPDCAKLPPGFRCQRFDGQPFGF